MQNKYLIYDLNNWLRVKCEESQGGAALSNLWLEVISNSSQDIVQIFVSDGFDSRRKRREWYSEYKAKRKPADQSFFDGLKFFKELLTYAPSNVFSVEIPYYEADDVIANIALGWRRLGEVHIISTDKDLTQLKALDNVYTLAKEKTEPKFVRLYKTFVGDSSDNIPGVRGFGEGAWEKTSLDWKKRMTALFYLEGGKPKMKDVLNLCRKEGMSDKLLSKIEETDLSLWYKLVSFIEIDDNEIGKYTKWGNNLVDEGWKKLQETEMLGMYEGDNYGN
jgi:5'-3' exonuclease